MKIRKSKRPDDYINVIPFIDVLLVLLIFFMVSSHFSQNADLHLSLPSADAKEQQQRSPEMIEITVEKDGSYAINGKAVVNKKAETLHQALKEVAGDRTDIPLILSADAEATHQSVVTAMDVAGQLGFSKLSITTQHNDNDK